MDKTKMNLIYESAITELSEMNSSFDRGVLRVAYTNQNRNGSFISKETFEKCLPSIYNCPIVCNYDRDCNDFGGHDIEVAYDDGALNIINITHPVGVIPESANSYWEIIDGKEYLCVDALIWKRQEAYKKLKEDGIVSESMEISVIDGYTDADDGLYHINDFEFTALCLLGSDVQPCFERASLQLFSADTFKQKMEMMMSELKETYAMVESPDGLNNTKSQENLTEGGKEVLEEKMNLLSQYGFDIEDLDFSIEDFSVEELKEKFDAIKDNDADEAPEVDESLDDAEVPEEDGDASNEAPQDNYSLNRDIIDEMLKSLREVTVKSEYGEYPKYEYIDCDMEANMIYVLDSADWLLYGFSYNMNGDNVDIDFDSKKRMKYVIVEFNEGEQTNNFESAFTQLAKKAQDSAENEKKFNDASERIDLLEDELAELRQFKADTIKDNELNIREEILSQFEELTGMEEFEELRENCMEYDANTLEEKCFAIRGRYISTQKFSLEEKTPKFRIPENDTANKEPYGGIVEKYLR